MIKRYTNPVLQTNGPEVIASKGKVPFIAEEINLIEDLNGKYVLYSDYAKALAVVEAARELVYDINSEFYSTERIHKFSSFIELKELIDSLTKDEKK